jgi:Effector Associated Constant Component 1
LEVRIGIEGEGGSQEMLSLFRWLSRDPDARRYVPVSLEDDGAGGTMGAADVISAVLTQVTSIGTLAVAIASWRDSRAQPAPVKIAAGDRSVIITTQSADEVLAMLQSLNGLNGLGTDLAERAE